LDDIAKNALEMILKIINKQYTITESKKLCAELILRESTN